MLVGLYFQIRDDYCNLSLKEYSENKSFCEDLTEGKFSFPIIHAITIQKEDRQVLRELIQKNRLIKLHSSLNTYYLFVIFKIF